MTYIRKHPNVPKTKTTMLSYVTLEHDPCTIGCMISLWWATDSSIYLPSMEYSKMVIYIYMGA